MKIKINGAHVSIYLIRHDGKPMYVGQTTASVRARIREHFSILTYGKSGSRCPKLHAFLQSNPQIDRYSVDVLEIVPKDVACDREKYWIKHFDTRDLGLNLTDGSIRPAGEDCNFFGKRAMKNAVEASVKARLGKPLSDGHKQKISDANVRSPLKIRTRVVRSDGREFAAVSYAASSVGVTHSAIIQAIRSGRRSGGYQWRYAGEEQKAPLPNMRVVAVECVETGERFSSLEEVCRAHKVSKGNLSSHLRGIYKSCKGRSYRRV